MIVVHFIYSSYIPMLSQFFSLTGHPQKNTNSRNQQLLNLGSGRIGSGLTYYILYD